MAWYLLWMLVRMSPDVLARLKVETVQTLTHFKLIFGVKVFVDHVQLIVSSIMDLANPGLPVVRERWFRYHTGKYSFKTAGGRFFLWVHGMGFIILLWHSLSLPYNY